MGCPTQNLGPIGGAVMTYVYLIQTNKQTPRHPSKVLYIEAVISDRLSVGLFGFSIITQEHIDRHNV